MAKEKAYKNLKLQEKYALYLTQGRNCKEVDSRTSKYRVFKGADSRGEMFYFLGKSGSIRFNRKNAVTDSMSLTDNPTFKALFVKWESDKI